MSSTPRPDESKPPEERMPVTAAEVRHDANEVVLVRQSDFVGWYAWSCRECEASAVAAPAGSGLMAASPF